ncbi:hypothetical protein BJ165DRAFT_1570782 [Panaeolus papilionaceus]|nr:hypothetical protein BJ165DRAFT_1570782 [Panaeolus papilionaceus]
MNLNLWLCIIIVWPISSLGAPNSPSFSYRPPSNNTSGSNMCTCSSVYYCLLNACSYCQGGLIRLRLIPDLYSSWNTYHSGCHDSDTSLASFPKPLPSGVSIPQWAYMDVTALCAQLEGSAPLTTSDPPGKHLNVAIISGCIVAAVVLLALCCIAFCVWKKKRVVLQKISSLGEDCVPYPTSHPPTPHPSKDRLRDLETANASWTGQLNTVRATRAKNYASTPAVDNVAINKVQSPQRWDAVNQLAPGYDPPPMQPPSYESLSERGSGA